MEQVDISLVEFLRCQGKTYEQISEHIKRSYSNISTGLSSRSVRRYCNLHSINVLSEDEVDGIVEDAVKEVHLYHCISLCYCIHIIEKLIIFNMP